jgi:hypothetical protein
VNQNADSPKRTHTQIQEPRLQRALFGRKTSVQVKGELKIRVPNPHQGGDISDSLLSEILRQAGISKDEWRKA